MKKLFMIVAALGLGLGLSGCESGPGSGGGGIGDGTQMQIAIAMPAGGGNTRANNFGDMPSTDAEKAVFSLDVWVFDADRNAVETGNHESFTTAQFSLQTITPALPAQPYQAYVLNGTMETTAGNVRVWVGLNLPAAVKKSFATEALLLEHVEAVSAMSTVSSTSGLAMFSNVAATELKAIPIGSSFADQVTADPTFNTVQVPVFRVVSKAIATVKASGQDAFKYDWTTDRGVDLDLTYDVQHWWLMQHATSVWVAPHYDVAFYNGNGVSQTRPETYYKWTETGTAPSIVVESNISQYAADAVAANKLTLAEEPTGTGSVYDNALTASSGKYIGENSRVGAANSLNKNTTHAFLSTGVVATKEAYWENGAIAWRDKTYGWNATPANRSDIILIKFNNIDYITSATDVLPGPTGDGYPDNIAAILSGYAATQNILIMSGPTVVDNPATDPIEMSQADFAESIKDIFQWYLYRDGWVHFVWWLNKMANNQYEVLRNQFIHLQVTGMNVDKAGTFPGYPGREEDPEIPIEPKAGINNPYPLDPNAPVDPAKTDVQVNVIVKDWTYRANTVVLGR